MDHLVPCVVENTSCTKDCFLALSILCGELHATFLSPPWLVVIGWIVIALKSFCDQVNLKAMTGIWWINFCVSDHLSEAFTQCTEVNIIR